MDVTERLTRGDWAERLGLLGFRDEDRAPAQRMIEGVLADEDDLARVRLLAARLQARIGDYFDPWEGEMFSDGDAHHRLGRGVVPMCALLATADDVHEHHLSRGIAPEDSWRALSDLGQQVYKDRLVNGSTGLHNHGWLRGNWAGGHAWIGRLQFELTRSTLGRDDASEEYVLSVHIPETGPLRPADCDEAFERAVEYFASHYPEYGPIRHLVCHSWLLDPVLCDLVPGSNVDHFQRRWTNWACETADRDGYYFGFGIEPAAGVDLPYGLDALPSDTRLHTAMIGHWASGGHFSSCSGSIMVGAADD